MTDTDTKAATPEEREAARKRIQVAVTEEALGIVEKLRAIQGRVLYADVVLRFDRHTGGPEIRIDSPDLSSAAIAHVQEIVHDSPTGFGVHLDDGRIVLESSSWPPDRIPF